MGGRGRGREDAEARNGGSKFGEATLDHAGKKLAFDNTT